MIYITWDLLRFSQVKTFSFYFKLFQRELYVTLPTCSLLVLPNSDMLLFCSVVNCSCLIANLTVISTVSLFTIQLCLLFFIRSRTLLWKQARRTRRRHAQPRTLFFCGVRWKRQGKWDAWPLASPSCGKILWEWECEWIQSCARSLLMFCCHFPSLFNL